jgi:YHS domain-containing protein
MHLPAKRKEDAEMLRWLHKYQMRAPAAPLAAAIDPVCGMKVQPASAAAARTVEGQLLYFCSQSCVDKFDRTEAGHTSPKEAAHTSLVEAGHTAHHHCC